LRVAPAAGVGALGIADPTPPVPEPQAPAPAGPSFEQTLRVEAADLDEQAHVNNVVYVRWVQEAATAHWRALATPELRAEVAWVATRHEIDYLAPAVLGDEIAVRTTVGHAEGLTFERLTEIRRLGDGRTLARSRTLWVPVDPRTGRPRRVSAAVRALASAD
jgi:acyl-CoA thioester hydrolase